MEYYCLKRTTYSFFFGRVDPAFESDLFILLVGNFGKIWVEKSDF